jgi:hypothetical protein
MLLVILNPKIMSFADGNVRVIFKIEFYMMFLYVILIVTNANVYMLRKHGTAQA